PAADVHGRAWLPVGDAEAATGGPAAAPVRRPAVRIRPAGRGDAPEAGQQLPLAGAPELLQGSAAVQPCAAGGRRGHVPLRSAGIGDHGVRLVPWTTFR